MEGIEGEGELYEDLGRVVDKGEGGVGMEKYLFEGIVKGWGKGIEMGGEKGLVMGNGKGVKRR